MRMHVHLSSARICLVGHPLLPVSRRAVHRSTQCSAARAFVVLASSAALGGTQRHQLGCSSAGATNGIEVKSSQRNEETAIASSAARRLLGNAHQWDGDSQREAEARAKEPEGALEAAVVGDAKHAEEQGGADLEEDQEHLYDGVR